MTIQKKFNFFINYSHKDFKFFRIAELCSKLEQIGNVNVLIDRKLTVGENWRESIQKMISYSDAIIVICSENTDWTMTEYYTGLYLDKPIIPIYIDPIHIPLLLRNYQGVNYNPNNFEKLIDDLLTFLDNLTGVIKLKEVRKKTLLRPTKPLNIFLSYASEDSDILKVPEIAAALENFSEINNVFYWKEEFYEYGEFGRYLQKHAKELYMDATNEYIVNQDISSYMSTDTDKYLEIVIHFLLEKYDILILFCTPRSLKSNTVKLEWLAFNTLGKIIIPIFYDINHIPSILRSSQGVKYKKLKPQTVVNNIYQLILSQITAKSLISVTKKPSVDFEIDLPFKAYEGEKGYLFISYAHKDKSRVYPVIRNLHNDGFRIWYDEGIQYGDKWLNVIAKKIKTCDVFSVFMSLNALKSKVTKNEVNYAYTLSTRRDEDKPPIFAFFIDDIEFDDLPEDLDMILCAIQGCIEFKREIEQNYLKIKQDLFDYSIKSN